MSRPTTPIELNQAQKELLNTIAHSRETPHSLVRRSQIILQAAQGINNKTISQNLGLCEDTVGLWRQRWVNGCRELEKFTDKPKKLRTAISEILADKARAGSPVKFSAEQVCQFIALACESPPEHLSHWTHQELVREAAKRGIAENISTSSAGRFLKSGGYKATPSEILAQS